MILDKFPLFSKIIKRSKKEKSSGCIYFIFGTGLEKMCGRMCGITRGWRQPWWSLVSGRSRRQRPGSFLAFASDSLHTSSKHSTTLVLNPLSKYSYSLSETPRKLIQSVFAMTHTLFLLGLIASLTTRLHGHFCPKVQEDQPRGPCHYLEETPPLTDSDR